MERQVSELLATQRKLGDAVGVAVDALLQDEGEDRDEDTLKKIRNRKREAVESLAYVRDLLKGITKEVDEERLYGEEEFKRRRSPPPQQSESKGSASPPPRPPEPVAAPRPPAEQRRQKSPPPMQNLPSHPLTSLPRTPSIIQSPQDPASATKRIGQAATLPRQKSGSPFSSTTLDNNSFHAPWNYTKSNFTAPSVGTGTLPRLPPKSSQTPALHRPDGALSPGQAPPRQVRRASNDPLGALSP